MRLRIWNKFPILNSDGAADFSAPFTKMQAKKTLYINADKTKIVPESSPDAAFLLAREGSEIPQEVAEQYGLAEADKTEKAKTPAANKVKAPSENK